MAETARRRGPAGALPGHSARPRADGAELQPDAAGWIASYDKSDESSFIFYPVQLPGTGNGSIISIPQKPVSEWQHMVLTMRGLTDERYEPTEFRQHNPEDT